jgi:hypothetical protein
MIRTLLVAAAAVVLVTGCGGNEFRKTRPVSGTLTINGAPAEPGVLVWLHPQFPESDKYPIHPKGETTEGGAFTINTYNTGDGAPEGEYIITVDWPQRIGMSPHFSGDLFGGAFSKVELNRDRPEFKVNVTNDGAKITLNLTLTPAQMRALEAAKKKVKDQGGSGFNLSGQ